MFNWGTYRLKNVIGTYELKMIASKHTTQNIQHKFRPDAINYTHVLAFNSRYHGLASAIIEFKTPEGVSSSVQSFETFPLGSKLQSKLERESHIIVPRITQTKLAYWKSNSKCRLHIVGTSNTQKENKNYAKTRCNNILAIACNLIKCVKMKK